MKAARNSQPWTLERLRDERCEEEGECWLWLGGMGGSKQGTPQVSFRDVTVAAFRLSWMLSKQLDAVPKGLHLWRTCRQPRCINPACIKSGTAQQKFAFLAKTGAYAASPSRKAASTLAARRDRSKLKGGIQAAREIRASSESTQGLSERYGVCAQVVRCIRKGTAWRETVLPSASIFSMGGGA